MNYFLGVDGGGSKTRAILVDAAGDVLLDVLSGPTNLNVAPEGDVRRSLEDLIDVFREKVKVDKVSACFGIAGTSNTTNAITLSKIFKTIGFRDFTLKTDAEIALAGAFKGDSGILLIAGTGSVCLAKDENGKLFRTGGWGWLVDDCGSASWIGHKAIEAAIKQRDGREPQTGLAKRVYIELSIEIEEQIIERLYHPIIPRAELGQLAPLVIEQAALGDTAAQKILDEAIDQLESLVRATVDKISIDNPTVCLVGGLLEHHHNFRDSLVQRMPELIRASPILPPAGGAAWIARSLSNGDSDQHWTNRVINALSGGETQRP